MKLYELLENYRFLEELDDEEIDAEALRDTLESIEGAIEVKIDNVASMLKNLLAEETAIKEEAKKLTARAKSKANKIEWCKNYLKYALESTGKDKLETSRNKVSFRKSKAVQLEDGFIEWAGTHDKDDLLTYKDPEPNKKAIKEAIEAGAEIEFATIVENKNLQVK